MAALGVSWGCGGSATEPEQPTAAPPAPAPEPPVEASPETSTTADADEASKGEPETAALPKLPTECKQRGDLCLLPEDFAERLCAGKYQDLAIFLFGKEQPWSRGYIRIKSLAPLNTYGGPVSTHLEFGEEVLIVGRKGGGGSSGVKVSGAGGYQVLRWDGTCATLADHEIVTYQPGQPHGALIIWKYLADATRDSLLADEGVAGARDLHKKECRGVRFGHSKSCDRAALRLNQRIRFAVARGLQVPIPDRLP